MGKVVEIKEEKKGQQQKRTHNSAPHSASNYRAVTVPVPASGPAPLRRSTRRKPNPDAGEIRLPSVPVPASGPAPLRRSTRRKPNPDADEIQLPSLPLPASGPAPLRRSTRWNPNPDKIRHVEPQRRIGFITDDERVRYREQVYKSDSGTPQLKFVRVLKAMAQACDMLRYYITFEAKDLADEGKRRTYEALVRIKEPPIEVNFSVMFIREYKQDKGKGKRVI